MKRFKNKDDFYLTTVRCGNCGYFENSMKLLKGKELGAVECPNCGTKWLSLYLAYK